MAQAYRKMPYVQEQDAEPPLEKKAEIISRDQDTHDKRRLPAEENMVSPQNHPMHLDRPQHTSTRTKSLQLVLMGK